MLLLDSLSNPNLKKEVPHREKRTCKGSGAGGILAHLKSRKRTSGTRQCGQLGECQTQSNGAMCVASEAMGWGVGFILSTMGSHGEDFKHRDGMI